MASNKDQTSGARKNTGVINAFVDSIVKNEKPLVDGVEALKAMRVIFAAEQSAREGKTIYIDQGI